MPTLVREVSEHRQHTLVADDVYAVADTVRTFAIGDRELLFCERTQRLSELNNTAGSVWRLVREGASARSVATYLRACGASNAKANELAASAICPWLQCGYITPLSVLAITRGPPRHTEVVRVGGVELALHFFGEADQREVEAVFRQFRQPRGRPKRHLSITKSGEYDFLFLDDMPLGRGTSCQTIPRLKATLTKELCSSAVDGFLAHGGLVSKKGKRVFIGGAPGAGKTTLVLALTSLGFAYGGDDIVHFSGDGKAVGVPFSAAAKSGAWPLLKHFVPNLSTLPVYQRTDGQLTRYVMPENLDTDGLRSIDVFLLLERRPNSGAELQRTEAFDFLRVLLESSYSERRAASGHAIEELSKTLCRGACYRLVYDGLGDAADLVDDCINE